MNDYSKWDKIRDSDGEEDDPVSTSLEEENQEQLRGEMERMDMWLRRQIMGLEKQAPGRRHRPGQPPELSELTQQAAPYRKLTKEDRKVLSMLIITSHFEEGTTNLDRHPQMLDLTRHHRWLEEDPGTLELLCQVHNKAMKQMKDGQEPDDEERRALESPEDRRMRSMVLSGINTLAAPKKCKCTGGLLELVTQICTPSTDEGRERRKKWQKKEYAKDALFDSLFPDLRQFNDEEQDTGWWDIGIFVAVIVLLIFAALFLLYGPVFAASKVKTTSTLLTTTAANAANAAAPEAVAASLASAAAGVEGREGEL
uniref:Uncharacterized protein n=1 Tax=Strombidinopsis acuminata TaxID=141414 RepID=A0A7S3S512_9SPIT